MTAGKSQKEPIGHRKALEQARAEIRQIDKTIVQQLERREAAVQEVIKAKRKVGGQNAYRPFREAAIIDWLSETYQGGLGFTTLEHIWREIMAGFTQLQTPFSVHVLGRATSPLSLCVRFHFGSSTPITFHETHPQDLTSQSQEADLWLWPLASRCDDLFALLSRRPWRVHGRLPYRPRDDWPGFLVLGAWEPERAIPSEAFFQGDEQATPINDKNFVRLATASDGSHLLALPCNDASALDAALAPVSGLRFLGFGPRPKTNAQNN